jgi:hypothetical protein
MSNGRGKMRRFFHGKRREVGNTQQDQVDTAQEGRSVNGHGLHPSAYR